MALLARCLTGIAAVLLSLSSAARGDEAALEALLQALQMDETATLMQEEGLRHAGGLIEDYTGEPASRAWRARVARIYERETITESIAQEMRAALAGQDLGPMLGFFESGRGQRIVTLELAARRALMAEGAEDAAILRYEVAEEDGREIVAQLGQLIADSDLVERNVSGMLNANLMFLRGLASAGGYDDTEEAMIRDVWAQEEEIRRDTQGWLGGYLMLAYEPLQPGDLEAYIAFWQSAAGQGLNSALFETFNGLYDLHSYLLGRALAEVLLSQEL
ncbi:DUF2059 domain-containing protein [Roseovarius sp. C7]|uniref:DUF2059 domain-containing protein n=1 Tax=Roseovarius sp. C7 TaxID=3398643 RepID=UPI0039F4EC8A